MWGEPRDARRWDVLHLLAAAAPRVPLRRLMRLACILRRAGAIDSDGEAGVLAARNRRPALQAAMLAPPPAPLVLLCAQRPVEASLPEVSAAA